ncbi:RNA-binding protein 41-like [Glandiceps talaboti]
MEESSSYDRTGIPRGDHRRYQSRGVTRVTDDPYTPYEDQSLDTPGKGVVTQAEIQLQRLLGKQLDTNVTLARQFAQHKSFTEGTTFKPFIERAAGQLSLEEFSELQAEEGRLEHLSQCGLTEEEILLKLEHDRKDCPGPEPAKKSKLGMAPAAYAAKLKNIERKIKSREEKLAEKEPETFSHVKVMSRHEMEIEKSLYRGTDRADQLSHLTTSVVFEEPKP